MGKVFCVLFVCLFVFVFVGAAEYNRSVGLSLPENGFVTRVEGLAAINDSESKIAEMVASGFSVVGVSADLVSAKEAFKMVDYSEVLRDANASAEARWDAIRAVGEEDWTYFHYGDVFEYTNAIAGTWERAYLSYGSLVDARVVYEEYLEDGGLAESDLMVEAESAFYGESYEDANNFALMAKEEIESGGPKVSFWSGFFRSFWLYAFLVVIVIAVVFHKKVFLFFIKRKILVKKRREVLLVGMMAEFRKLKFRKNEISDVVYNSRMKEFRDELGRVRGELVVLRGRLGGKKV